VEAIQSGKFGKLAISHGFACKARGGIGHKDFMPCVWYRRTFALPERWKARQMGSPRPLGRVSAS
jgi:hypothetical protein